MNNTEIKNWLDQHGVENYTINQYGIVDVDGDVNLVGKQLTSIPVQFGKVSGGFYCQQNRLTSLEYAPQHVGGFFDCIYNKLPSLHHIYKQIKQINGLFYCDLVPNMLGILMIKGVNGVVVFGSNEVQSIFNKHINGDIHACQEELIDAGYAEQAKL